MLDSRNRSCNRATSVLRVARRAVSLGELLAAAAIVGVLALILVPRLANNGDASRRSACHTLRGNIEVQSQLWYRNKQAWPLSSLADIAADANYFPQGVGPCPVDGTAYQLDTTTGQVIGHDH